MSVAYVCYSSIRAMQKYFQACGISTNQELEDDIVDDCAVPN